MGKIAPRQLQFQETFSSMYSHLINRSELEEGDLMVRNVTFVVTEDCNLRCTYCYEHKKNKCNVMSKETARKGIDMLFAEDAKNSRYINKNNAIALILDFIGGEPLLEIDLVDYIVEYFKYKAISLNHRWALYYMISFSTNGILYDTPKVQEFLRRNEGRVSMTITIDGNKDLHDSCRKFPDGQGSYDIVEKAYKLHLKQSDNKSTKLTMSPQNIMHLSGACKHLYDMGLTDIFANCVFEKGWELEHARILYKEMITLADYLLENDRYTYSTCSLFEETIGHQMSEEDNQNWCGGTGKMLAISSEGKVYPCLRYLPFSLRDGCKPLIIGDVDNGIETCEEQKEIVDMLNAITRRSQSTDECFNCPIGSGCAWCSAYNYEETGTPNKRVTYICIMHKARVLANYYYWNRVYQKMGEGKEFKLNLVAEDVMAILEK